MVSLDLYTQNIPLTQVIRFSPCFIPNINYFQKAKFWSNYVSSLKGENVPSQVLAVTGQFISVLRLTCRVFVNYSDGLDIINYNAGNQDLRANDPNIRNWHPSVIETLPNDYPELKMEFSKLESQMFDRPMRRAYEPLTPVIADANER